MTTNVAFEIPDIVWSTLAGSLMAAGLVAYLTQRWIEKRERRDRRDELRLELYVDVVDLVLKNETVLASRSGRVEIPPNDLQTERLRIQHCLKLLASDVVRNAYGEYRKLIDSENAQSIQYRSNNPDGHISRDDVDKARDILIELMSAEIQGKRAGRKSRPNPG